MPSPTTIALFVVAALALLLIPGPVVLYTIARSISQGRRAGLVSALSAGLGNMTHVLAATLGLSALLASSALAFSVVKYAGALYLIYLGVRTLVARHDAATAATVAPQPFSQIFAQGVTVSVLNPKTALFFLAFLPQFIVPGHGAASLQILILGSLFVGLGIVTDSGYALLASALGGWLHRAPAALRFQRYFAGGVYIALGVATALSGAEKSK